MLISQNFQKCLYFYVPFLGPTTAQLPLLYRHSPQPHTLRINIDHSAVQQTYIVHLIFAPGCWTRATEALGICRAFVVTCRAGLLLRKTIHRIRPPYFVLALQWRGQKLEPEFNPRRPVGQTTLSSKPGLGPIWKQWGWEPVN